MLDVEDGVATCGGGAEAMRGNGAAATRAGAAAVRAGDAAPICNGAATVCGGRGAAGRTCGWIGGSGAGRTEAAGRGGAIGA